LRRGWAAAIAWVALGCAAPPATAPTAATGDSPAPVRTAGLPAADQLAPTPAHVVLVSVTGLSPRAYRAGPAGAAPMPTLARLARAGAAADAVAPVAPASPGPVHATLATGRAPAAHGVGGDHPLVERGTDPARHREASMLAAPPLWVLARAVGASTALLGWPSTVGAPADWLFPEIFPARLGETSPGVLADRATPALLEAALRLGADRPEAGFPGPARDAILTGLACELLSGPSPPRLTLVRLSQTELPLRRDGADSERAREAFTRIDAELARLVDCLADAGRLAATALVVTGDVPVEPVHTVIRPNQALADAGLLVPRADGRGGVTRWDAFVRSNGTSAFVYARDPESAVLARRALEEAARATLAFRIVSAEEMLARGADREAWFGLAAVPGHQFDEAAAPEGRLLAPSAARGAWGTLDGAASPAIGLVAWGSGVRAGIRIPELRQTDVAPTVGRLLGLAVPDGEGRALVGVVRAPPVAVGPRGGRDGAR
jgi:predicted AlkP superfamily pyrophosphatase or phosphodiesterase